MIVWRYCGILPNSCRGPITGRLLRQMRHTRSDHAIALVKAALNLVPSIGGAVASLIDDYVPLSTQRSIEKAMDSLGEKLASLEGRIDVSAVNKDDFSELFKSCFLVIV